jgi:hypothetical protein
MDAYASPLFCTSGYFGPKIRASAFAESFFPWVILLRVACAWSFID